MDVNATRRQLIGWKRCQQHWSDACKKSAVSNAATAGQKFGVDYEAEARNGKLWIRYAGRHCTTQYDESCVWDPIGGNWSELVLKGVSWSGMHDKRTNCVEELGGFRYYRPMGEYIGAFQAGHFNAVRLPLYASGVLDDPRVNEQRCGRLSHNNLNTPVKHYMAALVETIGALRNAGAFVMLDMHSLHGEQSSATWCGANVCTAANENQLLRAWLKLADHLCDVRNVLLADIFNEPNGATWSEWRAGAARIGNAILRRCPRWLIGVQGVGSGSGECSRYAGTACWWGENIMGHLEEPLRLERPNRLVLLPHTYGHGTQNYMRANDFPSNMPEVWSALWGRVAAETGTPVIVGEW